MTTPPSLYSNLLPQHRPAACERFYPFIERCLQDTTKYVHITDFSGLAQITFAARFRDALNSIGNNNWTQFSPHTLDVVKTLRVANTPQGIFVGTKQALDSRTQQSNEARPPIDHNERIRVATLDGLRSLCHLIEHRELLPQPIFYFAGPIPPDDLANLRALYPNVLIATDPNNQQQIQFI